VGGGLRRESGGRSHDVIGDFRFRPDSDPLGLRTLHTVLLVSMAFFSDISRYRNSNLLCCAIKLATDRFTCDHTTHAYITHIRSGLHVMSDISRFAIETAE